MSETLETYSRKGLRTSYVSTVIGISLVLFMIGLVVGGMLGLQSIQTQTKENLRGDIFFKPEFNAADIKQIQLELSDWKEFKEVYFTIKTMQLVGATSAFIRKPFLVQSLLQGIVSALIGMSILMGLFYTLNNFLDSIEIAFHLETLLLLFGIILIVGIIITLVSTWLALNKYLRMKLDDLY